MNQKLSEDDVMRRLESYRPNASTGEWGQAERSAALEVALHTPRSTWTSHAPISRRRRWLTVAGGVAAVGVAVLVIELIPYGDHRQPAGGTGGLGTQPVISNPVPSSQLPSVPTGSATPAPLPHGPVGRLAAAARATSLGNPQDGQFWFHKIGSSTNWVAPNGDDWDLQDEGNAPSCTYYPYLGTPNPNHPNTDYLNSLPTDPDALDTYLRAHVYGSNSTNQAVFVAIADTLHNYEGLVPPDMRAAFIEVLGKLPDVTVRSGVRYGDGSTATTFTYKSGDSLWFDESTAQLVYADGAPEYQIVDKLPEHVASRQTCPRGDN